MPVKCSMQFQVLDGHHVYKSTSHRKKNFFPFYTYLLTFINSQTNRETKHTQSCWFIVTSLLLHPDPKYSRYHVKLYKMRLYQNIRKILDILIPIMARNSDASGNEFINWVLKSTELDTKVTMVCLFHSWNSYIIRKYLVATLSTFRYSYL